MGNEDERKTRSFGKIGDVSERGSKDKNRSGF